MIQINIPQERLGVGFSFFVSLLASLTPLAFLLGGLLGEWIGAQPVLMLAGSGYVLLSLYMVIHPKLNKLENRLEEMFSY